MSATIRVRIRLLTLSDLQTAQAFILSISYRCLKTFFILKNQYEVTNAPTRLRPARTQAVIWIAKTSFFGSKWSTLTRSLKAS